MAPIFMPREYVRHDNDNGASPFTIAAVTQLHRPAEVRALDAHFCENRGCIHTTFWGCVCSVPNLVHALACDVYMIYSLRFAPGLHGLAPCNRADSPACSDFCGFLETGGRQGVVNIYMRCRNCDPSCYLGHSCPCSLCTVATWKFATLPREGAFLTVGVVIVKVIDAFYCTACKLRTLVKSRMRG